MTKLTDWTGDLEYRYSNIGQLTKLIDYDTEDLFYVYPPTADLRHAVGRVSTRCPSGTRPVGLDLRCVLDLGCRRGLRHSDFT